MGTTVKLAFGSVAEWLALVTLIHVLQRTGGSKFESWFQLGSYQWILGEFSLVTRGEAPSVWDTAFVLPIHV